MVIDTHVHFIKPFDSHGKRQVYSPNPAGVEDYLAVMDKAGVDRAFYISWSPEDIPSDLLGKKIAVETVRETMNRDYALDVMRRYPDRFYWFPCHLGPTLPNRMSMARENLKLGAAGLKVLPSFWGKLPDDPELMPIYELAREFGAQIIIDTSYWSLGKDDPADPDTLQPGHRDVARRIKDWPDYFSHVARVVEAFPEIHFQLAHAGAREFTPEHAREVGLFMREHPNVFADLGALPDVVGWVRPKALESLVETAGEDRVMFGTDWPHFAQGRAMCDWIAQIRRGFSPGAAEKILGENALTFVKHRSPGLHR